MDKIINYIIRDIRRSHVAPLAAEFASMFFYGLVLKAIKIIFRIDSARIWQFRQQSDAKLSKMKNQETIFSHPLLRDESLKDDRGFTDVAPTGGRCGMLPGLHRDEYRVRHTFRFLCMSCFSINHI